MATVLMPLPDRDFDVTEVAIPWHQLIDAGHRVVIATERGLSPQADPLLISGVVFGKLGAENEAIRRYRELEASSEFNAPIPWSEVQPSDFDGLLLPGGHAPGMRQYLGSTELQAVVAEYWALDRPVGAICHGVLVLARTTNPETGRSVIAESRTTCLPKYMERAAYLATAWRRGRYYRTYPLYVEDEVRAALLSPDAQFLRGPVELRQRGTATDDGPTWVITDGRYCSARWPGDAYRFGREFLGLLAGAGE